MKLEASSKGSKEGLESLREPVDALMREGRNDMAYRLLKVLRPGTENREWIDERLGSLYRKWIPRWHFEMLNDTNRNRAFAEALAASDLSDKTVLDIGAGSGLLSMLAVRNGARHVYACEMLEPLADIAAEIVRLNGMANNITIIPKSSFDIEVGKDLPARADVMISETIDCGFVGEGFLEVLQHAKQHLLEPHSILIPSGARLCGGLIESPSIYRLNYVDHSEGFDVSKMNEFSTPGYFGVRLNTRSHSMLSEVKTLIDVDFNKPFPETMTHTIEFEANRTGTVHGIGFWFNVRLAPGIDLTNHPAESDGHWTQAFAPFCMPLSVQKGVRYFVELIFSQHAVHMTPVDRDPRCFLPPTNGISTPEKVWQAI